MYIDLNIYWSNRVFKRQSIYCLKHFATGDGIIDNEEFEYVLSEFGCSERVARQAFTIVTKVCESH